MSKLQLVKKTITGNAWALALIVALGADILDYAVIGAIPVYGDIFDIIVMGILFRLVGWVALLGVIELVPIVGDFVPTYLIIVVIAWLYHGTTKKR